MFRFGQFCVYCYAMVAIQLRIHSSFGKVNYLAVL